MGRCLDAINAWSTLAGRPVLGGRRKRTGDTEGITEIHGNPPDDVRETLSRAVQWLAQRQPFLASCFPRLRVRTSSDVTLLAPDSEGGGIVVNPEAVRDLGVEAVAGALVGAALAAPGLTGLPEERYDQFQEAVQALWRDYLDE